MSWFKPEAFQIALAVICIAVYMAERQPGKVLYWIGVIILTADLYLMKG